MKVSDGMNYAPKGKAQPVVKPGEFIFSAAHLDHGHIYGMTNGLLEAGGTLKYVYDPDPKKVEAFVKAYPQVKVARSEEELLNDKETNMVCGAAITNERCALGLRAMQAGKDYFTDKAPFTTLEQLDSAKKMVAQTGKKYMVYYGERLHVEGAVLAEVLIFAVTGICLTVKDAARVVVSQSEAHMADSTAVWKVIRQKANALAASGDADMKRLAEEIRFADPMPTSIDGEIAAQVDALAAGVNGKNVQNLLKQLEQRKLLSKHEK